MDIYKVKLTQEAEDDLIAIYDYICETLQAPQAAQRQYHRLAEEILSLDFFPERYAVIEAEARNAYSSQTFSIVLQI